MKISVIMIDGSFRENLFSAQYFSNQDFPGDDYEIIWVEHYHKVHPDLSRYPRVKSLVLDREGLYHSSYCFNAGIEAARGDILVVPDADLMVEEDFLSTVYREHEKNRELVMYFYRFCQGQADHNPNDLSFSYIRQTAKLIPSNVSNFGGCLTVRRNWLEEIDGYETHRAFATGNHANGKDVYTRLKNLGLYVKWHPRKYLFHPWHPGTDGRGADKKRVMWQQGIIKYRGTHLMTTAFAGLSGTAPTGYTVPPPPLGDPDKGKANK